MNAGLPVMVLSKYGLAGLPTEHIFLAVIIARVVHTIRKLHAYPVMALQIRSKASGSYGRNICIESSTGSMDESALPMRWCSIQ